MKLRISVTKEILEKSKMCGGNVTNCAVALAVRDIFPKAKILEDYFAPFGFSASENWLYTLPENNTIYMPPSAGRFINEFDSSMPELRAQMKPISFEVDVPDEVIARINIDEIKELLKGHPTLQLC